GGHPAHRTARNKGDVDSCVHGCSESLQGARRNVTGVGFGIRNDGAVEIRGNELWPHQRVSDVVALHFGTVGRQMLWHADVLSLPKNVIANCCSRRCSLVKSCWQRIPRIEEPWMAASFRKRFGLTWDIHGDGKTITPGQVVKPDERMAAPQTIGIGLQHVMAMFGATVLVPALTGFPPTAALFFSG